jgi:hypothetical protein
VTLRLISRHFLALHFRMTRFRNRRNLFNFGHESAKWHSHGTPKARHASPTRWLGTCNYDQFRVSTLVLRQFHRLRYYFRILGELYAERSVSQIGASRREEFEAVGLL